MPDDGFISDYTQDVFRNWMQYTAETESPVHYNRWSWLTSLGACIGRKAWTDLGVVGNIYPTLYVQLLGAPSTRKSTPIKIVKRMLAAAGYANFSASKTRVEKFLSDLAGIDLEDVVPESKGKYDAVTAENLWGGDTSNREPREVYIVADEFNDFAGAGNTDFYTLLGNLWDWDSPDELFKQRFKNSRSVSIYQPTISLLSGNTPELFARCFPPETLGTGFLARLLLIHGEPSGRRITIPPQPDKILTASLISYLNKLMAFSPGHLTRTPEAMEYLDAIYQQGELMEDVRFKAYDGRRFTQLLKLAVIISTAKFQKEITGEDVIQANTILSHAEILMPKALGEFGKSKNSDVANKILAYLDTVSKPASIVEIWKQVRRDLPEMRDLVNIMQGLQTAEVVQTVQGVRNGFLPKKKPAKLGKYVDWSFLTQEEREMI